METKELTPQLSVAQQISAADLSSLAQQGFRTVINNRPDGEAEGQPLSAELAAEASRLGLVYIEIPVSSAGIINQNVSDFGEQLASAETPILAFCRTGTRSTTLWALDAAITHEVDHIIDTAKRAGYDLSKSRERLEAAKKG